MSIQAASVCKRGGEVLLSRQFVELSSSRVHEIMAVYPRLLQEDGQHTTLEEGGVRYIYEPLDELFVVLASDAATSNIIKDLSTLRLLTQLVKQTASSGSEAVESKDIVNATYSIIDAFDEVVTMGFSENLTASQVETFLKMESHEEKIQQIIERNKQLEAAEERKKKAKQLEAQRSAAAASHSAGFDAGSSSAFGSRSDFGSSSGFGSGVSSSGPATLGSGISPVSLPYESSTGGASAGASALKGKGLKLGKKATPVTGGAGLPLLATPEPINEPSVIKKPAAASASAKSASPVPPANTTVISISEQLTTEMTRDGHVKTSRVSGTLNLFAGDREHAQLRIKTTTGGGASDYKPHPKMDRASFASNRTLGLKNSDEKLPASYVLLVKWTVDNVVAPLAVNCWVSEASDAGFMNVTLEYEVSPEFKGTLENVAVNVPLPTSNAHAADPASNFEQFDDHIVWLIPHASADAKSTGSFEFTAEADNEDDFYPLEITFATAEQQGPGALTTFGKIDVESVVDATNDTELAFTKAATAQTASYLIR